MIDAVIAPAGNCAAKIEELLQPAVGRFRFQQPLPFDFESVEALSQPLVFATKPGEGIVIFAKSLDPIGGALRGDLQRPENPHQQRADRFVLDLAARRRG